MALTPQDIKDLLDQAVKTGMLDERLRTAEFTEADFPDRKYLFAAAARGQQPLVQLLIQKRFDVNRQDQEGNTPLCFAVEEKHLSIIQDLLAAGANVNASDRVDVGPLFRAAATGRLDIVQYLVEHGADISQTVRRYRNNKGQIPLHAAAHQGRTEVVAYLIKCGSAVSQEDDYHNTPLHLSCSAGHITTSELLLDNGADIHKENIVGDTPLKFCVTHIIHFNPSHLELAQLLIDRGADPNNIIKEIVTTPGCHQLLQLLLDSPRTNCLVEDNNGNTLLHLAAQAGCYEYSTLLVGKGIHVAKYNREGQTAAHVAVIHNLDIFSTLETLAQLFAAGFSPNQPNRDGDSLLHIAVQQNNTSLLIEYLLRCGANSRLPDAYGETALHIAAKYVKYNSVELLLEADTPIDTRLKQMTSLRVFTPQSCYCLGLIAERENNYPRALENYKKHRESLPRALCRAALLILKIQPDNLRQATHDLVTAIENMRTIEDLLWLVAMVEKQPNIPIEISRDISFAVLQKILSSPMTTSWPPSNLKIAQLILIHARRTGFSAIDAKLVCAYANTAQQQAVAYPGCFKDMLENTTLEKLCAYYVADHPQPLVRSLAFYETMAPHNIDAALKAAMLILHNPPTAFSPLQEQEVFAKLKAHMETVLSDCATYEDYDFLLQLAEYLEKQYGIDQIPYTYNAFLSACLLTIVEAIPADAELTAAAHLEYANLLLRFEKKLPLHALPWLEIALSHAQQAKAQQLDAEATIGLLTGILEERKIAAAKVVPQSMFSASPQVTTRSCEKDQQRRPS